MTLTTKVMITSPGISGSAAFLKMRQLLGAGEQFESSVTPTAFRMGLGQGLPALMYVEHLNGSQIPAEVCDEWCDADCVSGYHDPAGYVLVVFDTAYGYRVANGATCSDLHAWLLVEMGAWITAQGCTWQWYDECGDGWEPSTRDVRTVGALGNPARGALTQADHDLSEQRRVEKLATRAGVFR